MKQRTHERTNAHACTHTHTHARTRAHALGLLCRRYASLLQRILRTLLVDTFPSGIMADAAAAVLCLLAAEREAFRDVATVRLGQGTKRQVPVEGARVHGC